MALLPIVLTLIIVGLLLWVVNTYIPMEAGIKKLLNVVVIIFVVLWLLQATGLLGSIGSLRVTL